MGWSQIAVVEQPGGELHGQLVEEMLEERRKARFWAALEAETPDREYLDELAQADPAFVSDAERSIARFESGR